MQFEPKTEKQLQEEVLLPKGIYPFEVQRAEAKRSKAGNDMIELELRIFTPEGKERGMRDWLMAQMGFKLFHFCAYTGLSQKYESGTLQSHDCEGKSGFVEIVVREDKSGYGPSNSVKDYVRPDYKKDTKVGPTDKQLANQTDDEPADVPY